MKQNNKIKKSRDLLKAKIVSQNANGSYNLMLSGSNTTMKNIPYIGRFPLSVNDIVNVGFHDNDRQKPFILAKLSEGYSSTGIEIVNEKIGVRWQQEGNSPYGSFRANHNFIVSAETSYAEKNEPLTGTKYDSICAAINSKDYFYNANHYIAWAYDFASGDRIFLTTLTAIPAATTVRAKNTFFYNHPEYGKVFVVGRTADTNSLTNYKAYLIIDYLNPETGEIKGTRTETIDLFSAGITSRKTFTGNEFVGVSDILEPQSRNEYAFVYSFEVNLDPSEYYYDTDLGMWFFTKRVSWLITSTENKYNLFESERIPVTLIPLGISGNYGYFFEFRYFAYNTIVGLSATANGQIIIIVNLKDFTYSTHNFDNSNEEILVRLYSSPEPPYDAPDYIPAQEPGTYYRRLTQSLTYASKDIINGAYASPQTKAVYVFNHGPGNFLEVQRGSTGTPMILSSGSSAVFTFPFCTSGTDYDYINYRVQTDSEVYPLTSDYCDVAILEVSYIRVTAIRQTILSAIGQTIVHGSIYSSPKMSVCSTLNKDEYANTLLTIENEEYEVPRKVNLVLRDEQLNALTTTTIFDTPWMGDDYHAPVANYGVSIYPIITRYKDFVFAVFVDSYTYGHPDSMKTLKSLCVANLTGGTVNRFLSQVDGDYPITDLLIADTNGNFIVRWEDDSFTGIRCFNFNGILQWSKADTEDVLITASCATKKGVYGITATGGMAKL